MFSAVAMLNILGKIKGRREKFTSANIVRRQT
jgi:hypothetical protein